MRWLSGTMEMGLQPSSAQGGSQIFANLINRQWDIHVHDGDSFQPSYQKYSLLLHLYNPSLSLLYRKNLCPGKPMETLVILYFTPCWPTKWGKLVLYIIGSSTSLTSWVTKDIHVWYPLGLFYIYIQYIYICCTHDHSSCL